MATAAVDRRAMLWFALACTGSDESAEPDFPTPWEYADDDAGTVSGNFLALLDREIPGAGGFTYGDVRYQDAVFARRYDDTGTTWPVIAVRILGRPTDGWHSLELDVSLSAWAVGEVPIDGDSATGLLVEPDGTTRYLVEGTLVLTEAGFTPGARVRGSFEDVIVRGPL